METQKETPQGETPQKVRESRAFCRDGVWYSDNLRCPNQAAAIAHSIRTARLSSLTPPEPAVAPESRITHAAELFFVDANHLRPYRTWSAAFAAASRPPAGNPNNGNTEQANRSRDPFPRPAKPKFRKPAFVPPHQRTLVRRFVEQQFMTRSAGA